MWSQGCYVVLWEYLESQDPVSFDYEVKQFGIEAVFCVLQNYVIEYQVGFEIEDSNIESNVRDSVGGYITDIEDNDNKSIGGYDMKVIRNDSFESIAEESKFEPTEESDSIMEYTPVEQEPEIIILTSESGG